MKLREIIYLPWAEAEFVTEDYSEKAAEGFVLAVVRWQRGWQGDVQHSDWTLNETHQSTTDPDARLYRKGPGMEARLCFIGHGLMEKPLRVCSSMPG